MIVGGTDGELLQEATLTVDFKARKCEVSSCQMDQ